MNKQRQDGFLGLELLLLLVLVAVVGLAGYYVWKNHQSASKKSEIITTIPKPTPTPKTTEGCSLPVKAIQVDKSMLDDAKAAFIAKGFTATWFDQHSQLISIAPATNKLTVVMTYQICVGGYRVNVKYHHSANGSSQNFVEIYAPAHDINSVVPPKVALESLKKCGGDIVGSPEDSAHFGDLEDNGALYPKQSRLYIMGIKPDLPTTPAGGSAIMGGRGGIIKTTHTYVDIETGKCFNTTTAVGV